MNIAHTSTKEEKIRQIFVAIIIAVQCPKSRTVQYFLHTALVPRTSRCECVGGGGGPGGGGVFI